MFYTYPTHPQSIAVHITDTMLPQHSLPIHTVMTYTCIKSPISDHVVLANIVFMTELRSE